MLAGFADRQPVARGPWGGTIIDIRTRFSGRAGAVAAAPVAVLLGACSGPQSMLAPAGPAAAEIARGGWLMTGLFTVVWVGVLALLVSVNLLSAGIMSQAELAGLKNPSMAGVLEQVVAAGKEFDLTPYGTETMHVLRAEKGYPIIGQDTDGTVSPHDLGMAWAVSKAGFGRKVSAACISAKLRPSPSAKRMENIEEAR